MLINIYTKVIEVIIIQLNIEHFKTITYMITHGILEEQADTAQAHQNIAKLQI